MNGLYIHVPFCERKCGYCSFYSVAGREHEIDSWLDALEWEAASPFCGEVLNTLYIGGGTPTILNISQWKKLFEIINRNFNLENLIEATVEANPNSLDDEKLKILADNKISRISLGVQSLNDDELKILGRLHDSYKALKAMESVKKFNLMLNCDLIFAIPSQTLKTWSKSLKGVLNFADHVSTYQLTLESETPLGKKYKNSDLNEDGYKFYRYVQYYLPKKNFIQYEISNFAPEGNECRHNLLYWNHDNVIGLGASAVSYIDGVRIKNPDNLEKYLTHDYVREFENLSGHEKSIELAILQLRTKYGIKINETLPEIIEKLNSMPEDLFIKTPERISLSKRGMRLGNSIWCELIDL